MSKNIKTEMDAGRPQKQAIAIAYSMKRKKKMAKGGPVESMHIDPGYMKDPKTGKTIHRPIADLMKERMASGGMVGDQVINPKEEDEPHDWLPEPKDKEGFTASSIIEGTDEDQGYEEGVGDKSYMKLSRGGMAGSIAKSIRSKKMSAGGMGYADGGAIEGEDPMYGPDDEEDMPIEGENMEEDSHEFLPEEDPTKRILSRVMDRMRMGRMKR